MSTGQILRLRAEGVSQRGIAELLGCSRNTVSSVFVAATAAGVGFGEVADLAAEEVRCQAPRCTPGADSRGGMNGEVSQAARSLLTL